jgi:tetrathionate reductase subunit B
MKPAMIIDYNRCTGCLSCVEACIAENINRVGADGENIYPENVVEFARTRPVKIEYGDTIRRVFRQCLHCERPPCVYSCPTGASHQTQENVVLVDDKICIKCGLCIEACPYGVRTFLETPFEGMIKHEHALKDRIPDKCTFCYHRKDGDSLWIPACVESCPHKARHFGDLEDPDDPVTKLVKAGIASMPREDLGTSPKLYIIPRKGAFEEVKYPVRREDQLITYTSWSTFKEWIVKPIFTIGAGLAVILGLVHMIRERRKEVEEGGE